MTNYTVLTQGKHRRDRPVRFTHKAFQLCWKYQLVQFQVTTLTNFSSGNSKLFSSVVSYVVFQVFRLFTGWRPNIFVFSSQKGHTTIPRWIFAPASQKAVFSYCIGHKFTDRWSLRNFQPRNTTLSTSRHITKCLRHRKFCHQMTWPSFKWWTVELWAQT